MSLVGFSSSSWPSPISSRRNSAAAAGRPGSRSLAGALTVLAALAVALAAPRARAADPPARVASPADSAARAAQPKSDPFKVMLRSALVPGWGQLYNHQPLKAAAVVGGEGFLFASA